MKNNIFISLIVPCYNEELNLQKGTLDKINHYTAKRNEIIEIIIVDDGSTDNSRSIIKKEYLNFYPKFKLIEQDHTGKAGAIITGVKNAKGNYIVYSDFDLATPINELDKLIKYAQNDEKIIIGSRAKERKGAPISRRLQSTGFILLRDLFLNLNGIVDTQCGFKMFDRNVILNLIDKMTVYINKKSEVNIKNPSVTAGFDLELLFLARKKGYKIIEVPVEWHHVETKRVNFIRDSIESIKDIFKIKYADIKHQYDK